MQKSVTKKVKRTKVINTRLGNKKQGCRSIHIATRKPAIEDIKKNTFDSVSDSLIKLYNETDYQKCKKLYELLSKRLGIDNIFWVLMNNKNKKFLS